MKKLLLVFTLLLAAAPSFAAQPASFNVRVEGSGRPMILIPGLSSPCSVWDTTIEHYAARYEVHCLTLAGFAGVAPVEGEFLPRVRRDVVDYIKSRKLDRPVIIGHSLGGFLALWIGATEPHLPGAVVAVDGLPALGAVMNPAVTRQQLEEQGEGMYRMLAAQTREQFAAMTRASLASMMTSSEDADRVAALAVQSDPGAVARAVKEMLTTDLRNDLRAMTAPLLLIAASGGMPEQFASSVKERYEAQLAAANDATVVVATKARHFVMLDDPAFFFETVDAFLRDRQPSATRKHVEEER